MDSSKLLKTLGIGQGNILAPHIDMYLQEGDFPSEWNITIPNFKDDDGWYHPSSHCFASPRLLYYDRGLMRDALRAGLLEDDIALAPRKIGASLRKTFDCGHMWHGYVGAVLVEMGFVKEENVEQRVKSPKVKGSGTADLVDVEIPGNGTWLVDMKTMNSSEFNRGANPNTFKKWEAQVNCYMDWVGAERAMILAIQKDSPHNFREYVIEKKPDLLEEIYARWALVEEALAAGTPPPCDHGYGQECELGSLCEYA